MSENMTQLSAMEARRNVETLADSLIKLAERLRRNAQRIEGNGKASAAAADIVNTYMQHGAPAGSRIEQMLINAADADRVYRSDLHHNGKV